MSTVPYPDLIPMTVIGGWLGSGKTTLLNRLLTEADERIAVVVNDVGDINIDAGLIDSHHDTIIELTNGCICCSIGGSLAITLRDLTVRDPPPERIVVEASGVARPGQVARYGDRMVVPIDSIVVVADAVDIRRRVGDHTYGGLARDQLADADLIVISKTDLLEPTAAADVADWIRSEWPEVPTVRVDADSGWAVAVLAGGIQHRDGGSVATSTPAIHTATVGLAAGLDPRVLRTVLEEAPPEILRVKGFVADPGSAGGMIAVHLAGRRVSFDPIEPSGAVELGRLVMIASDLRAIDELAARLRTSGL